MRPHVFFAEKCLPSGRNPKILSNVPTGFTLAASTQVAGRGRGTNVWIAPPGSLIHSTVINHPAHLAVSRPIVFIQYIASIAIVEAIQSYAPGYEKLPVKIKWPNDICKSSEPLPSCESVADESQTPSTHPSLTLRNTSRLAACYRSVATSTVPTK